MVPNPEGVRGFHRGQNKDRRLVDEAIRLHSPWGTRRCRATDLNINLRSCPRPILSLFYLRTRPICSLHTRSLAPALQHEMDSSTPQLKKEAVVTDGLTVPGWNFDKVHGHVFVLRRSDISYHEVAGIDAASDQGFVKNRGSSKLRAVDPSTDSPVDDAHKARVEQVVENHKTKSPDAVTAVMDLTKPETCKDRPQDETPVLVVHMYPPADLPTTRHGLRITGKAEREILGLKQYRSFSLNAKGKSSKRGGATFYDIIYDVSKEKDPLIAAAGVVFDLDYKRYVHITSFRLVSCSVYALMVPADCITIGGVPSEGKLVRVLLVDLFAHGYMEDDVVPLTVAGLREFADKYKDAHYCDSKKLQDVTEVITRERADQDERRDVKAAMIQLKKKRKALKHELDTERAKRVKADDDHERMAKKFKKDIKNLKGANTRLANKVKAYEQQAGDESKAAAAAKRKADGAKKDHASTKRQLTAAKNELGACRKAFADHKKKTSTDLRKLKAELSAEKKNNASQLAMVNDLLDRVDKIQSAVLPAKATEPTPDTDRKPHRVTRRLRMSAPSPAALFTPAAPVPQPVRVPVPRFATPYPTPSLEVFQPVDATPYDAGLPVPATGEQLVLMRPPVKRTLHFPSPAGQPPYSFEYY